MNLKEINKIEELYRNLDLNSQIYRYELQILEGYKAEVVWNSLTDSEKLEIRKTELNKKKYYKELYSELQISYESKMIDLIELIHNFLDETNSNFETIDKVDNTKVISYRLQLLLSFEIFSINKHKSIKNRNFFLFENVINPIFSEIELTEYYTQFNLRELRTAYENCLELFNENPYS